MYGFDVDLAKDTLSISILANQNWYLNTAVVEYSEYFEENPESFELKLRFWAYDTTNPSKEDFDTFSIVIKGTGQDKSALCYDTLDNALTIDYVISGDRYYQVSDESSADYDGWTSFIDEATLSGLKDTLECR
jgi:hypothetical protein